MWRRTNTRPAAGGRQDYTSARKDSARRVGGEKGVEIRKREGTGIDERPGVRRFPTGPSQWSTRELQRANNLTEVTGTLIVPLQDEPIISIDSRGAERLLFDTIAEWPTSVPRYVRGYVGNWLRKKRSDFLLGVYIYFSKWNSNSRKVRTKIQTRSEY